MNSAASFRFISISSSGWNISDLEIPIYNIDVETGHINTFCNYEDMNGDTQVPPCLPLIFYLDVLRCVKEKTFSLSSTIKQSKMNSSIWSSNMANVYYGFCHTFTNPEKLPAAAYAPAGVFYLNPNLTYRVILHDPLFYHVVINGLVFPRVWLEYKKGQNMKAGHFQRFEISLTEHRLLNRPEQPCEEEEDYDFLKCVKTSQARMVGCRPPWDSWSPHTIPLCQTVEQLHQYELMDLIFSSVEQKMIMNYTGCESPCKYKVSVLSSVHRFNN